MFQNIMTCERYLSLMETLFWAYVICTICGVYGLECPANEHNFNNQRCCNQCPPGKGVRSPCTLNNNTVCQPCKSGLTYSAIHSHEEMCRTCTKCGAHSHLKQACDKTHDTVCECDTGYYYNIEERTCKPCDKCPPGQGTFSVCSNKHNTKCRRCPNGTFSDRTSLGGCMVCSACRKGNILLQICSAKQNTVCINMPEGVSSLSGYGITKSPVPVDEEHDNTASELIPLYCTIMGAIIIGLLVYVIIKNWRRGVLNRRKKASLPPDGELAPAQGSDSGVYDDQTNNTNKGSVTVTLSTKICDLPSCKRKIIEKELNTSRDEDRGWAGLARELGYNTSRIASLEVRAEQDQNTPIHYLLTEWGKCDTATVAVLVNALKNIGCHDVAKALHDNIDSAKTSDQEIV